MPAFYTFPCHYCGIAWPPKCGQKVEKKRRLFVLHFVFCHFFITVFLISRRFLSREFYSKQSTRFTSCHRVPLLNSCRVLRVCHVIIIINFLLFKWSTFFEVWSLWQAGQEICYSAERMSWHSKMRKSVLTLPLSIQQNIVEKMSSKQIKVSKAA